MAWLYPIVLCYFDCLDGGQRLTRGDSFDTACHDRGFCFGGRFLSSDLVDSSMVSQPIAANGTERSNRARVRRFRKNRWPIAVSILAMLVTVNPLWQNQLGLATVTCVVLHFFQVMTDSTIAASFGHH